MPSVELEDEVVADPIGGTDHTSEHTRRESVGIGIQVTYTWNLIGPLSFSYGSTLSKKLLCAAYESLNKEGQPGSKEEAAPIATT